MTTIARDELKAKLDGGEHFYLVETLPLHTYLQGHLPGAINLPPDEIREVAPRRLPEKDAEIIVYSESSHCGFSDQAGKDLMVLGYTNVRHYEGGKVDWADSGLNLDTGFPSLAEEEAHRPLSHETSRFASQGGRFADESPEGAAVEDGRSGNVELLKRVAFGVVGGLAGTLALQALLSAGKKWFPETVPPLRQDPGEFMAEKAQAALPDAVRRHIPQRAKAGAGQMLGLGYGLTFGALYGALRPRGGSALVDGALLGMACWAVGYLGWLPALGLMPPVSQQKFSQAVAPAVEHILYGVATVTTYDCLRQYAAR